MPGYDRSLYGGLPAIALLLSMMAVAGVVFAISLVVAIGSRSDAGTIFSEVADREWELAAFQEEINILEEKLVDLRVLEKLEELVEERNHLSAQLALSKREYEILKNDKQRLLARLEALGKSKEFEIVITQRNRKEIQQRIKLLSIDIKALEQTIKTVMRELKSLEEGAVRVSSLVPGGIKHSALFVECDGRGIRMMPEDRRLSTDEAKTNKSELLERASVKGLVMFLVRPDGFDSFHAYRKIIETHNRSVGSGTRVDFGYQPVDEDWALVYPGS